MKNVENIYGSEIRVIYRVMHNSIANNVEQRELTKSNCYTTEPPTNGRTNYVFQWKSIDTLDFMYLNTCIKIFIAYKFVCSKRPNPNFHIIHIIHINT